MGFIAVCLVGMSHCSSGCYFFGIRYTVSLVANSILISNLDIWNATLTTVLANWSKLRDNSRLFLFIYFFLIFWTQILRISDIIVLHFGGGWWCIIETNFSMSVTGFVNNYYLTLCYIFNALKVLVELSRIV